MSIGLATRGYFALVTGGSALETPTITNVTPARAEPGEAGAFSLSYSDARNTPIEFDVSDIAAGAGVTISVKFGTRDETYVALAHDGTWLWPFDVDSSIGELASEPVHVSLLPRDGWPPTSVDIKVAAVKAAVEV